ncbi:hypothetical protein PUNSTDRAFT_54593 [Punctularia strigosozonata HHB-11173 SS5]|uniref:uncharacterized protein n=1 Tax=Punctularia strigosozonata (strain HHB-11173) TaxID=741275 RepID=UPI0004418056|nr:uncharacterized protein PUNSTDRAFT_54593 [Punctularia strigosozonata HHB-11173 SS5]EIN05664.1 hypothetical protein PUNSTDRAFT_54593 [Punctularia strigosozonata HHB-11173 SS5]
MADVLNEMRDASIIHLACHGHQDRNSPLDSGFTLRDGQLTVSEVMRLKLPNTLFAFLAACESATGDREQPDESIHLGAAMLFMGVKSVIGTLWPMNDADGPMVSEIVYDELFKSYPRLDMQRVPYALDAAARKLRDGGAHYSRWATYIHMGI